MPMNERNPVTMKDIAKELGVSVATVSRALKDSPRISEVQRERIKAFAREHNFSPNILAESLRRSKTSAPNMIGVILPQITHYYFSSILSGIENEASRNGYHIMVAQSMEQFERERNICESFMKHRVCGVIVSQAKDTVNYDHFKKLMDAQIQLVFYDRICTGINTSRVVVDDYMGAFKAVSYLLETGCKRVAYYGATRGLEIMKNRYNGYRDAILKHGMKESDCLVVNCETRADAETVTPEILSGDNRPDAFFAVNDDTAIGILYTAKQMGLRVPEDISICGYTNGISAVACDPMLTTVEQRGQQVGEEAVKVLLDHVEGRVPIEKVEKRVVRTRLVVRGTTRKGINN